ncbi:hypothetical protein [Lutibacter sp.]|uniref:hypothetical protein n=1 Tax=Lutibacter sp. TaxID=1925666 RepID=UPI0035691BBE
MKKDRKITEICLQCNEHYVPTRKGVQKFCGASCRSRYWFIHNQKSTVPQKLQSEKSELIVQSSIESEQKPTKIEEVSLAGISNAALGTILANSGTAFVKSRFTKEEDKPATKGDLKKLEDLINKQYFEVYNVSPDIYGRRAYFDMATSKIVYYDERQRRFEFPPFDLQ